MKPTLSPLSAQENSLETAHAGASSLDLSVGVRLIFRDFLHLMTVEPDDREAPCLVSSSVMFLHLAPLSAQEKNLGHRVFFPGARSWWQHRGRSDVDPPVAKRR